tara:strand:- start:121 stop:357 length:237 start_codon:yes stop_codon:yes gene_type:complete
LYKKCTPLKLLTPILNTWKEGWSFGSIDSIVRELNTLRIIDDGVVLADRERHVLSADSVKHQTGNSFIFLFIFLLADI